MKNFNIQEAINRGKIVRFSDGPKLIRKELGAAEDDLTDAKDVLKMKKFKLSTVSAYYAIFHAARALLYKKKYREKSHIQLVRAIKALFIDTGLLPEDFYNNFLQAFSLREMADYKRKFSKEGAEQNIQHASQAIKMVKTLLKKL